MEVVIEDGYAPNHPPFKIKKIELTEEEISARVKDSSEKVKKCFWDIIAKCYQIILKFAGVTNEINYVVRILISISIVSMLAHIGVQGAIVKKYFNTDNQQSMINLLCFVCLFFMVNLCFLCPWLSPIERIELRFLLYGVVLQVYVAIFCSPAHFLRINDFNYFIASLILFLLSVNVLGVVVICTILLSLAYYIAYCFSKPIFYLKLKCCYNPKRDENAYNIYYYDPRKTSEKTCTICLVDFEESNEIRICRTHLIHIFHEKCISDWLSTASTCPLCGGDQPAKFH